MFWDGFSVSIASKSPAETLVLQLVATIIFQADYVEFSSNF